MEIRRSGNFGFIDNGNGQLYTFAMGKGWEPGSSLMFGGWGTVRRQFAGGHPIIPKGQNNDMPLKVKELLDRFYAGEGILGKIAGLQWGQGPRFYRESIDEESNTFRRQWVLDDELQQDLDSWTDCPDWQTFLHRCLVDLVHMNGFWVKFVRNRGPRVGMPGRIVRMEHIPDSRVCYVYPENDGDDPTEVLVSGFGDFPNPDARYLKRYPLFDPAHPFKAPVSVAYFSVYTFGRQYYSVPRFMGAWKWLELAGGLAQILQSYNANASAISLHIESPQSYWDRAEERLKEQCTARGEEYTPKKLEEFKDAAMKKFAENITGSENAGKFLHTSKEFDSEADDFVGWKVTPVDKKIKDYIDAQIKIANKADAAATSGFGLDPVLSNLIIENKLSSGSEKLYSLKVYQASETAIPDMILCQPLKQYIAANFPGKDVRVGMYRPNVEAEQNVSPAARLKENA